MQKFDEHGPLFRTELLNMEANSHGRIHGELLSVPDRKWRKSGLDGKDGNIPKGGIIAGKNGICGNIDATGLNRGGTFVQETFAVSSGGTLSGILCEFIASRTFLK